jgi:hypothetical protein
MNDRNTSMKIRVITPADKELLKNQIELEESNFKFALELRKDASLLLRMKDHIKELKDALRLSEERENEI